MSARFMNKAILTATLVTALSPWLAATATTIPAGTAGALQLDPPAAPSNCRATKTTFRDRRKGNTTYTIVDWRDNSGNEDGFTVEQWRQNASGAWVLGWSMNMAANSTALALGGIPRRDIRYLVKAFNASGDSAWSNWAH